MLKNLQHPGRRDCCRNCEFLQATSGIIGSRRPLGLRINRLSDFGSIGAHALHPAPSMPDGAPRIPGFSYTGLQRYSLTVCVHGRRGLFAEQALVSGVLGEINRAARQCHFRIHVYCFMPDHVHLLVEGECDDADLKGFMKSWKQKTGFDYSRRTGDRLWQVGFFDHVLRSDESTRRHALYILGNPLRAGLARTIGKYPFAGCDPQWLDGAPSAEGLGTDGGPEKDPET